MINMRLSKRLKTISEFIDIEDKIIDIGCDHALLDIYIKENIKNDVVIASDIHEGALSQAKKNITKHSLDGIIELRLGDGLDVIDDGEVNTIIIAGMGYNNIVKILSNSEKMTSIEKIIVQSNTDVVKLRKFVIKLGFKITREKLVMDKDIIYTVIEFKRGTEKYDYKQIYFGPRLMENKDELFNEYYSKKFLKYENLLLQLPKNSLVSKLHHMRLMKIIKEEVEINDNEKDN